MIVPFCLGPERGPEAEEEEEEEDGGGDNAGRHGEVLRHQRWVCTQKFAHITTVKALES